MKRSKKYQWLFCRLVLAAAIVFVCIAGGAACQKAQAALSDCIDATCRITATEGSRGTGCCFERSQGQVFVLTAAHVVGGSGTVQCEFWHLGHQSRPITGVVASRSQTADAAVVAVPEAAFAGIPPKVVPIAPRDYRLRPGAALTSVGCAGGSWSTGFRGHALGYRHGDLHFVPAPANGRSGSAIFDAEGEKIVGLLRARTADDREGIATSVQSLYAALGRGRGTGGEGPGARDQRPGTRDQGREIGFLTPTPSPLTPTPLPLQCPGGSCNPRGYLLPYRYREQFRNNPSPQPQQPVYPTLPYPAPSIDLGPTNQKLDKIAELLIEMRSEQGSRQEAPPMPVEPPKPPVDNAATEAAEEAKKEAAAAKAEIEVSKQETSKLRTLVNQLAGDRETLRQRFEARLDKVKGELGEDASRRDVARAYVKDLVAEKLGGGSLGWTTGKVLGGALGLSGPLALAIGAGLWLLSRRIGGKIEADEPLLIHRLIDRVTDKVDDLKDRLRDEPAGKSTS